MKLNDSTTAARAVLHRRRLERRGQRRHLGGEKSRDIGKSWASIPNMGAAETRRAIAAAAAAALPAWRARTAKERAIILRRWFDLMMRIRKILRS